MTYYKLEPWGSAASNWQMASIGAVLANKPELAKWGRIKPEDFMPRQQKPKQSPAEMKAIFSSIAAAHNAGLKRRK